MPLSHIGSTSRRVTELTQKNGAKYAYTYDPVHRLTSITTPLGLKRELTYDVADNVIKDTDNLDRTNTYEYDIMHRMTKSVNAEGGVTTYGYDIRGNQNQLKRTRIRGMTETIRTMVRATATVIPVTTVIPVIMVTEMATAAPEETMTTTEMLMEIPIIPEAARTRAESCSR